MYMKINMTNVISPEYTKNSVVRSGNRAVSVMTMTITSPTDVVSWKMAVIDDFILKGASL